MICVQCSRRFIAGCYDTINNNIRVMKMMMTTMRIQKFSGYLKSFYHCGIEANYAKFADNSKSCRQIVIKKLEALAFNFGADPDHEFFH